MVIWRSGERGWHDDDARPWMRDRQPHALVEVGTSAINYWNTKAVLVPALVLEVVKGTESQVNLHQI
jgi:hypothetical protein